MNMNKNIAKQLLYMVLSITTLIACTAIALVLSILVLVFTGMSLVSFSYIASIIVATSAAFMTIYLIQVKGTSTINNFLAKTILR